MSDIELKKRIGNKLAKIIAFEPDVNQVDICNNELSKLGVEYSLVKKGVWSSEKRLQFSIALNKGCSSIDVNGKNEIEVTSVDTILDGKRASFIKMDIEGAEKEAFIGCEKTIKQYRPKLAICVYHKPEDILEIPELILSFGVNYKFYLRHYSPGFAETVLYAVPE